MGSRDSTLVTGTSATPNSSRTGETPVRGDTPEREGERERLPFGVSIFLTMGGQLTQAIRTHLNQRGRGDAIVAPSWMPAAVDGAFPSIAQRPAAPSPPSTLLRVYRRSTKKPGLTKGISFSHEYGMWLGSSHRVLADSEPDFRRPSMSIAQT